MNRRGFLGRLAVGAAAVLGAGAVKAGTAEAAGSEKALAVPATKDIVLKDRAKITGATISTTGRVVIDGSDIVVSNCTITSGGVTLTPNAQRVMLTGNLIQPWPEPFAGTLGPGTYVAPNSVLERGVSIRGAGIDKTTIVLPPTFGAMQADCAAQGCSFTYEHATGPDGRRWVGVTHGGTQKHWHLDFSGGEAVILDQIDAERRELHED